jgi:hypothetical protein
MIPPKSLHGPVRRIPASVIRPLNVQAGSIIGIGKRKTARKENVWGNESGSTQRVNLEVILLKKLAGALLFGAL